MTEQARIFDDVVANRRSLRAFLPQEVDSDEGQALLKKTYLYQASCQSLVASRN